MSYVTAFKAQCPALVPMITSEVAVHVKIWYASRRPDLDESVILDAMQGRIYPNDRAVREKHIYWGLDKDNPRATIVVTEVGAECPFAGSQGP